MGKVKISSAGLNSRNNQNENMLLPVPKQSFWQTSTKQSPQCCQEQASNAPWVLSYSLIDHIFPILETNGRTAAIMWLALRRAHRDFWQMLSNIRAVTPGHVEDPSSSMSWLQQQPTRDVEGKNTRMEHAQSDLFPSPGVLFSFPTPNTLQFYWARKPPSYLIAFSGF